MITNTIVNRGLLGVGGESNLRLAGKVTNTTDGEILVRYNSRITFTQGLAVKRRRHHRQEFYFYQQWVPNHQ